MAAITFDRVFKRFGEVTVLKDFDLAIADQEFLVLVGRRAVARPPRCAAWPTSRSICDGTISIGDRVVNDVPPKDRDVAMVFQSYALYPYMSVYDNMAFGLKLRKTPKVAACLRLSDCTEAGLTVQLAERAGAG